MHEGEVGGPVPERLDDGRVVGRHRHTDRHADELAERRAERLPGHQEVGGLLGRRERQVERVLGRGGLPPESGEEETGRENE